MRKNLWLFLISAFFFNFYLASPIFFLFEKSLGLNFFQLGILEGVFALFILLLEIPSGIFADKYGRKTSLFMASFFSFISYLFYSFAQDIWFLVLGQAFGGVALSFASGAGEAFLFDELKDQKKEKSYAKNSGYLQLIIGSAFGISAIITSFLAPISLRLPIVLNLIPFILAAITAIMLKEPKLRKQSAIHIRKKSWELIKNNKTLQKIIIYRWFVFGLVISAIAIFYQPLLEQYGLEIKWFGLLFLITGATYSLGSFIAHKLEKFNAYITYIILGIFLVCLLFLAKVESLIPFMIMLILGNFLLGLIFVLTDVHINKLIPSAQRATIISYGNLGRQVFIAIMIIFAGFFMDYFGYPKLLNVIISIIVLFLMIFLTWKKHLNKSL